LFNLTLGINISTTKVTEHYQIWIISSSLMRTLDSVTDDSVIEMAISFSWWFLHFCYKSFVAVLTVVGVGLTNGELWRQELSHRLT